jgi:hypothetical protein
MKLVRKLGMALRTAQKSTLFAIIIFSLVLSSVTPPLTVQAVAPNLAASASRPYSARLDLAFSTLLSGYWNNFTVGLGKIFSDLTPKVSPANKHNPSVQSETRVNATNTTQS